MTAEPLALDADAPAGLVYVPEFLTLEQEKRALDVLEDLDFHEVVMHGQAAKRTVRHFGLNYEYSSRNVAPTEPLPSDLEFVRDRCAEVAEVEPDALVEVLVTRYPPGAGIGWHRDAPMFGRVVGVSLASACTMRFRRDSKEGKLTYELELLPRSAYVFRGQSRWTWQHSIRATPDLRYSITFRTLRDDKK